MFTKLLMMLSAGTMAILGLAATFFPTEILNYAAVNATVSATLFVQVTGALYLSFAIMNWMSRRYLIGGIYSKPLSMGNFMHYFIAALALIKAFPANHEFKIVWVITAVYILFALLFAWVTFNTPSVPIKN